MLSAPLDKPTKPLCFRHYRFRLFSFPSQDEITKKKEKDNTETNIKKVSIAAPDDFEKCYIFAPSIGKKKNIGGKTYNITRYFNGNRDFETSMKELATKQVNRNAR